MQTVFAASMFITILIFFAKKSLWPAIQGSHNITLQQSFFCWFTKEDIYDSQQASTRWILVLNNITNILAAFCFLLMLVSLAVIMLSLMS